MLAFRRSFLSISLAFLSIYAYSQKVGVVLSGGGSSGMAHIGMLKALEENNIPVDYISGTSIGAFVGAMYCIGYTPGQMEQIALSKEFRNWVYGEIDPRYQYYFKKSDDNASWITLRLALDTTLESNLPTNVVSSAPLDLALLESMSPAGAAANNNFDSLFIPFRCIAADIVDKKSVIFRDGDLSVAVRASISYPFYLKPIPVNGRLMFDGGIYNNFPQDVMYDELFPDIILGCNVSDTTALPDEDNLLSQMKTMLLNRSSNEVNCPNGIVIEPNLTTSTFDFSDPKAAIDSGYAATIRQMPLIKERIPRRVTHDELAQRRIAFLSRCPPLVFGDIKIEGLKKGQSSYVRGVLRKKGESIAIHKFKPAYFRLVEDDKIEKTYPRARFNKERGNYDLIMRMKKQKDIDAELGGNISNRPISVVFGSFTYKYLGHIGIKATANGYFGKLYGSAHASARVDFPFRIPFYVEPEITFNRWDYFKSSNLFFEDVKPAYLIEKDQHAYLNIAMPVSHKDKLVIGGGPAKLKSEYYQTEIFTQTDTPDVTNFEMLASHITYERNDLNRKQYATQGTKFAVMVRHIHGEEYTQPGSTNALLPSRKIHQWLQSKLVFDKYYKQRGTIRMGVFVEGVYIYSILADNIFFNNYTAAILSAPAFQPLSESKTLFQPNFRAHSYGAIGLKNIVTLKNRVDLRLEVYAFQPYRQILKGDNNVPVYDEPFARRYLIGSASLVGHTPVGPIAFSTNYYHGETEPFSFLFHFGYIIFNKRATD